MQLTIALWSSASESRSTFVDATTKHQDLSFSTLAHGGFGDASFTIPVSGWNAVRWYRSYLGFHVVIFDQFGRRIYEGKIEDTQAGADGVQVTCLGYFSHAKELTHGMIYLAGDNLTPTQLVQDTVDIAQHQPALAELLHDPEARSAIGPQDYGGKSCRCHRDRHQLG
jgi:hypothetical protein